MATGSSHQSINFEDVLQQMRQVRVSIEEDRKSAITHVAALEARIKQLEAENASLKSTVPASTGSTAPSESSRVPPGHCSYTWQHGMECYSPGAAPSIPPGHNQYTWSHGMVPTMFDSPVASALLAPPAAAAAAPAAPAQAAPTPGALMRVDKFQRTPIARLLQTPGKGKEFIGTNVTVCGWARTVRIQGAGQFAFVELSDGSCFTCMQVVVNKGIEGWEEVERNSHIGCSFMFQGDVVASQGKGQAIEINATRATLFGACDPALYPLSKGRLTLEHLRNFAHVRPRTNTIGAVARVRSCLATAVHEFFQQKCGAVYVHAPILTSEDCEGAGEQFRVSTLTHPLPLKDPKNVDYSQDFFGQSVSLTVSGQLEAEAYACSLSSVYTFGPTFRAENSNTYKHLAEFWMIEPEFAFADISDNIRYAVNFIKFCVKKAIDCCPEDIAFFDKQSEGLLARLREIVDKEFTVLTYTEAVDIICKAKKQWVLKPEGWGADLASEHERYLTDEVYKGPVVVINYPKAIKSFYMRQNDGCEPGRETVAAMDVLLPRVGEIIGGSQREERIDHLQRRMAEVGIGKDSLQWYLDLRRFGTVPHAGFGLGFERLVMICTGLENIRDSIPFPRYPGHCNF